MKKPTGETDLLRSHDDQIGGLIERVTFHSEDTGYCVLKVKVKGRRDPVTVVGTLFSVSPGEWVDARGAWAEGQGYSYARTPSDGTYSANAIPSGVMDFVWGSNRLPAG